MSGEKIWQSFLGKTPAAIQATSPSEPQEAIPPTNGDALASAAPSSEPTSQSIPPSGTAAGSAFSAGLIKSLDIPPGYSLEDLLLNQMDIAVLNFAQIMQDHGTLKVGVGETQREVMKYSFSEKMKAAEFVRDWVQRRRKIAPAQEEDQAPSITELRKAIREETLKTLEAERVLKAPPKKNGRPTRAEAAEKKALEEMTAEALKARELADDAEDRVTDDNELQRALRGEA